MAAAQISIEDDEKNVRVISNNYCKESTINGNKGFIHIVDIASYSNLYYFKKANQQLLSLDEILLFKGTDTFTYIIFQLIHPTTREMTYLFRARPVYSYLESFAKHDAIYNLTLYEQFGMDVYKEVSGEQHDDLLIVFAGEIKRKTSNSIIYNFSSGTFMLRRLINKSDFYKFHISYTFDDFLKTFFGFTGRLQYNQHPEQTILNTSNIEGDIKNVWSKIGDNIKMVLLKTYEDCELITNLIKLRTLYMSIINRMIRINAMQIKGFKIVKITDFSQLESNPELNKYNFIKIANDDMKKNPKPETIKNATMNQTHNKVIYNYILKGESILHDISSGKYNNYANLSKGGRRRRGTKKNKRNLKKRTNKRLR